MSPLHAAARRPGHELRRPIADILRDEIYELRPSHRGVQYRILYFFRDRDVVVLSHGIMKRQKVPDVGNSPCGGTQAARARRSATVFLQVGSQGGLICLQCADSSPTRSRIFWVVMWG